MAWVRLPGRRRPLGQRSGAERGGLGPSQRLSAPTAPDEPAHVSSVAIADTCCQRGSLPGLFRVRPALPCADTLSTRSGLHGRRSERSPGPNRRPVPTRLPTGAPEFPWSALIPVVWRDHGILGYESLAPAFRDQGFWRDGRMITELLARRSA